MSGRIRAINNCAAIRQPNGNDCWAAASAMTYGRYGSRHMYVSDVKRIARDEGVRLRNDGSLPTRDSRNTRKLARGLKLHLHNVQRRFSLRSLVRMLQRGRVAIFGAFNYPGSTSSTDHAVCMYRAFGDGSDSGTTVSIVDPFDGRYYNFAWDEFYVDASAVLADPHYVMAH